jgi:hypothetical protein
MYMYSMYSTICIGCTSRIMCEYRMCNISKLLWVCHTSIVDLPIPDGQPLVWLCPLSLDMLLYLFLTSLPGCVTYLD